MIEGHLRAALRSAAGRLYAASPPALDCLRGKVVVLMYHRVIPKADARFVQPGMYVTPETFGQHLEYLRTHFKIISFPELLDKWDAGGWDNRARYAVITFDDGWLDNYQHAYPLLAARGLPATIFLPSDLIGTNRWLWCDRLAYCLGRGRHATNPEAIDAAVSAAKKLPKAEREGLLAETSRALTALPAGRRLIDWSEAHEMSRHGITFGSHTCSHAILPELQDAALERELRRPLEVLADPRIADLPVLAYPDGRYDRRVAAAAAAAGYRAAVTTDAGAEAFVPSDRFAVRRIGVHDDVTRTAAALRFHIARQAWAG